MTGCAIAIKNRNELEGDADEDGWDFWTGNESSLIFTFSFAFEEDEWESLFLNLSLYHCCGWLALEGGTEKRRNYISNSKLNISKGEVMLGLITFISYFVFYVFFLRIDTGGGWCEYSHTLVNPIIGFGDPEMRGDG